MRRGFRQVTETRLRAVADALPPEAPAADGDDGLVDVPGDAEPFGVDHLGRHERHDALTLIILEQEEPGLGLMLPADRADRVLGRRIGFGVLVDPGRVFAQIQGDRPRQQDGDDAGHEEEPGGQAGGEKEQE